MASTYLTISDITYETARLLVNNLVAAKYVNRQYDNRFAKAGAKINDVTNIRLPVRNEVMDGSQAILQDDTETSVPVRLDKRKHIAFAWTVEDRTLRMDDYSERYIKPKVAALANQVDKDVLAVAKRFTAAVGTPGTTPNSSSTYLDAGVKLDNFAAPQDDRRMIIVPSKNHARLVVAEQTLFNRQEEISRQHKKGRIGVAHGFNWYMDQNCPVHTYGTYSGTPLVNTANQIGATLITDGWGSGVSTLNENDLFTLDGVYSLNPQSYDLNAGDLQQFRVVQTISDTAGAMTIQIDPEIVISGPFRNVSNSPANDAAITVLGTTGVVSPQGFAFHRDAIVLAMVDLEKPGGNAKYFQLQDEQTGISIMVTEGYDIMNFRTICRLDLLYGVAPFRKELGVRIQS